MMAAICFRTNAAAASPLDFSIINLQSTLRNQVFEPGVGVDEVRRDGEVGLAQAQRTILGLHYTTPLSRH